MKTAFAIATAAAILSSCASTAGAETDKPSVQSGASAGQASPAGADPAASIMAAQKAALAKLDFMLGRWLGDGWVDTPGGRYEFRQDERVESRLGGGLYITNGNGTMKGTPDRAPPAFMAVGIISFDEVAGKYHMRSYTRGRIHDYDAAFDDKQRFVWGNGGMRYIIWLDDEGRWVEIGERSDGKGGWIQFFEMTLTRAE